MTQDAQGALRRIMETYARITRFCLVCNYVTRCVSLLIKRFDTQRSQNDLRIIDPLASRCSKFRFTPLDPGSISARLSYIATSENIFIKPDVISALISSSSGDLRRSITYLQSASRLSGSTEPPTEITVRDIQEIAGVVPDIVMNDFADALGVDVGQIDVNDRVSARRSRDFDSVRRKVTELVREGYSASQALSQVRPYSCSKRAMCAGLIR
jgi:replication factor C subunit 2/4